MMDNIGSSTRELNHEETQLIKFPVIQGHLLKTVPNGVMNIYWNLNQDAYFSKQTAINAFLQIDPEKFRELIHFLGLFNSFKTNSLHFTSLYLFLSNASLHRVDTALR